MLDSFAARLRGRIMGKLSSVDEVRSQKRLALLPDINCTPALFPAVRGSRVAHVFVPISVAAIPRPTKDTNCMLLDSPMTRIGLVPSC